MSCILDKCNRAYLWAKELTECLRAETGQGVCVCVFECLLLLCVLSSGTRCVYVWCVCVCELCKEELITEVAITSVDGYIETQTDWETSPCPCPACTLRLPDPTTLQLEGIKGNQLNCCCCYVSHYLGHTKNHIESLWQLGAWDSRVAYRVARTF